MYDDKEQPVLPVGTQVVILAPITDMAGQETATAGLEEAFRRSTLPEAPTARAALDDLLVRLRLRG